MQKIIKISTSCLMIFLLLLSTIAPALAATENREGFSISYESSETGSCTLASGTRYYYGGGVESCLFTINGKTGICSWAGNTTPPSGTVTATKYYLANGDIRAKIFYWLLVGTDATAKQYQAVAKAAWNTARSSSDTSTYWIESWTHSSIDYLQQGSQYVYGTTSTWANAITDFIKKARSWQSIPGGAKVYYYYPNGTASQSMMSYEYKYGFANIIKKSGNTAATNGNKNYSLENAGYGFYTNKNCTTASYIGVVTTDAKGRAYSKNGSKKALRELAFGTYYVKETVAPKGYELDPNVYTIKVTENNIETNPVVLTVTDTPKKVYAKIVKKSSRPDLTDNVPMYSMKGIQYTFYTNKSCTIDSYIGAVTLDEYGVGYTKDGTRASLRNLYANTYYIKEYFPAAIRDTVQYALDPTVHTVNLTTAFTEIKPFPINLVDNPKGGGYGQINKESAQPEITDDSDCYSLEGAVYCVYRTQTDAENANTEEEADRLAFDTITTNDSGIATFGPVDPGTYYVREKIAPKGYALDPNVYPLVIKMDETTVQEIEEIPQMDPIQVLLQKKKISNGEIDPAFDMSGAEYTFKYYSGFYNTVEELNDIAPTRTWVLVTDEDGYCYLKSSYLLTGDEFYLDEAETPMIPLGTLTVQETKAPPEKEDRRVTFYLDDTIYLQQITSNNNTELVDSYNYPTSFDEVIPTTEIKVTKKWSDDDDRDGLRPDSITLNLYRNGELYQTGTLASSEGWYYTFRNLPTGYADFNLEEKFVPYTYTIEEVTVDGYNTIISDITPDPENDEYYVCDITNTHTPSRIRIDGTKVWDDFDDLMKYRPESITVNLYANGHKVQTTTTNASKDWKYSFDNLYEYENGKKITYTVTENSVRGYTTRISGFTITNLLKRGTSTVRKVDQNGNPMEHVGFKLFNSSGKQVKATVNGGKYVFAGLTDEDFIYYTSSDGTVEVTNLPFGTYHFEEVETLDDYMPYDKPMNIELNPEDDNMSASVTVQNNKSVMPNAGGAGNIIYYIIASSFAVVAVVLILLFYIKKKNNKRKEVSKE